MQQIAELEALQTVTQARYRQQQHLFQKLQNREAQLRGQLAQLDGQLRQSNQLSPDLGQLRAVGADLLWQAWVGRSKENLNLHLAQVLAQIEHQRSALRSAYGKTLVATELLAKAKNQRRKKAAQIALDRAIELSQFK
ncbi:MAG: hypothetical protein ACSHWZ_00950 [Sulfitobacter sp.]